jgi:outer membrane protein OmpA-like peptidoglycan-associated protein
MNSMTVMYKKLFLGLCLLLLPCVSIAQQAEEPVNRKAKQLEIKADRAFIRGDYDRAMRLYGRAESQYEAGQGLDLRLKMARIYTLLQSPEEAIPFYDMVRQASDTKLTVNDVCFYIDALRQTGQNQLAEIVARQYAFLSPYSRNQRYLNTVHSLSDLQRYYGRGDSDYAVTLEKKSSAVPEYWVGKWGGDVFYAISNSRIQDPLKIFYHQTQYYSLDANRPEPFRNIPRELQSGPVAFSDDNTIMVATGISYNSSDRIGDFIGSRGMFVTQLYYSVIDARRGSWLAFQNLFEYQQDYNYAHPVFFDNGRSIVFSSDRPGGYGGMDLYIAHWNEADLKWSDPFNLGPVVNTEGDEIFPRILEDALYFASNGLEGYGGYDIFGVSYRQNRVLPGSLHHYPYPINSVSNDFGMFFEGTTGYFISDRRGFAGKDDIYSFDMNISPLNSRSVIGVSDEYSAMTGHLNLIRGFQTADSDLRTTEKEVRITPTYYAPKEGEVLLSVYFDFNSSALDARASQALDSLLGNPMLNDIAELQVLGYADEFGSAAYNIRLSTQRAEAVARAMYDRSGEGALPTLTIEGRGQLMLTPGEYAQEVQRIGVGNSFSIGYDIGKPVQAPLSFEDRVQINRRVRRVDIVVKKNN